MYLWLVLLYVWPLSSSIHQNLPPRTGVVTLYLDGTGYIPNYQQLQIETITETKGLWCLAPIQANEIFWTFPNGDILPNVNTKTIGGLKVILTNSNDSIALGLLSANGTITLHGVFTCSVQDVPREGSTTLNHVWIVNGPIKPIIDTQACQLDALLIFENISVILASARILKGAPTTALCQIHGQNVNRDATLTKIVETRFILDRNGDSEIVMGYFTPFDVSPAELVCTISNSVGSDSFVCFIKDADLSTPTITSITNDFQNPLTVKIEWDPAISRNNVLRNYIVYVQQPNNSFSKYSTRNTQILLPNIFFDLVLNQNIFVTANSEPSQDNRIILLPIIGAMRKVKCKPTMGYLITVTLTSTSTQNTILSTTDSNIIESIVQEFITNVQSRLFRNCTVITPQIQTSLPIRTRNTGKSRNTRKSQNTGKNQNTGKSRNTGSRARSRMSVNCIKTKDNTGTRRNETGNDKTKKRSKGKEGTTNNGNVDVVNNSTSSETDDEDKMQLQQKNKTQEQTQKSKDRTQTDEAKEKGRKDDKKQKGTKKHDEKDKTKGTKKDDKEGKGIKGEEDQGKGTKKNKDNGKGKGTKKEEGSKGKEKNVETNEKKPKKKDHTKKGPKKSRRRVSTGCRESLDMFLIVNCNACEFANEREISHTKSIKSIGRTIKTRKLLQRKMSHTKSIPASRTRNTRQQILVEREHSLTILGEPFIVTLKDNQPKSQRIFFCGERQVTYRDECDCPDYCEY